METLPPDPLRLDARDLVVRQGVVGPLILAALVLAIAAGWSVGPWLLWSGAFWGPAATSGLLGLPLCWIGATLARGALRGLRGERWILRLGAECLWLCPRSYFNEVAGRPAPTWLRLPLDEVAGVRPGEQRRHVSDGEGGRTRITDRWLDLELRRPAGLDARRAVDDERLAFGGTRFHSFPLEWRGERTLRVYWQTGGVALTPDRERLLGELGRRVPVLEEGARSEVDGAQVPLDEVDALARNLYARGHVLDAVRLLRERRGWSLAHTRNWLRESVDEAA